MPIFTIVVTKRRRGSESLLSRHPDTKRANLISGNNKSRPDLRFAADRRLARAGAKVLHNKHSSLGTPVYRRRDSARIIVESGSRRQRSSPRSSGTATRPDLADCCAKQARTRASRENRNDSRGSQSLLPGDHRRWLRDIRCTSVRTLAKHLIVAIPADLAAFVLLSHADTNNHPLCLSSPKKIDFHDG